MIVLGIESSADETSAAVVKDGNELLSNVVTSSIDLTTKYGGIVPEVVARSHLEVIIPVIAEALEAAKTEWNDVDAIAVTYTPGLLGSLLIGVLTARTLAIVKDKPLYGVNHVAAHVAANYLTKTALPGYSLPAQAPLFPLLALTVSGGHTQITIHKDPLNYTLIGYTHDDAVGEAYDKVAKILGLPYPGGPSVANAATQGDPKAIKLPRPHMSGAYDFSFSGLKTAVLRASQALVGKDYTLLSSELPALLNDVQKADVAASFQSAAVDYLADTLEAAVKEYKPVSVALAGGVAANQALRQELINRLEVPFFCPDLKLCGDNAGMIAALGYYQAQTGQQADKYSLDPLPTLRILKS